MANRLATEIRTQIEELTIALRVIERMNGTKGHARALKRAEDALTITRPPRRRGRPKGSTTKQWTRIYANRTQGGKLPDVQVPAGLSLAGTPIRESIVLALKAFKRPATTPELCALLLAGGFKVPKDVKVPIARYVGLHAAAAMRTDKTVNKTGKGWTAR